MTSLSTNHTHLLGESLCSTCMTCTPFIAVLLTSTAACVISIRATMLHASLACKHQLACHQVMHAQLDAFKHACYQFCNT